MEPIVDRQDEDGNYTPRDFADWREIPLETLERKEVRQKLAEALASLGEKYREVFVLRDMQHLSIEETAKTLRDLDRIGQDALAAGTTDAARSAGAGTRRQLEQQVVF